MKTTVGQSSWAVAFVLYHPPLEIVSRIELLRRAGLRTYLWLNSNLPAEIETSDCVLLNTSENNVGLGKAFVALLERAKTDGYQQLLYFDQDTVFTGESLGFIDTFIAEGHLQSNFAAIRFCDPTNSLSKQNGLVLKPLLLSSGMLFNLKANATHDEGFFVEGVDYQFCLDAASKGWDLGEIQCPGIDHLHQQPLWQYFFSKWKVDYRPYPLRRHLGFLWALIRLSVLSIYYRNPFYAWLFTRNLLTHLIVQLRLLVLSVLTGMRLAKKAVYL